MLITNEQVVFGPEFNGDMYPHGFGDKFMKLVSEVKDNVEFIKMNNKFNKENHGYNKIMSRYQGKFSHEEISVDGVFSIDKIFDELWICSDWTFIKNTSDKTVKFNVFVDDVKKVIEIKSGDSVRLNFKTLYK